MSVMSGSIIQLFPSGATGRQLEGLYLEEIPSDNLHNIPFVYANFISSLDGRIGLPRPNSGTTGVPADITDPRDWRLYQELAAQSDVLITSARYFRQALLGEAQDHLPVGPDNIFEDLRDWRRAHGRATQPAIAILSGSLDIPEPALAPYQQRGIHIFTTDQADDRKVTALERTGARVHVTGHASQVDGNILVSRLAELGFQRQYAIGGPAVFYTLASSGLLNRLYLTLSFRILAGDVFDSLIRGPQLDPSLACKLRSLYLDSTASGNGEQLYAAFDTVLAAKN